MRSKSTSLSNALITSRLFNADHFNYAVELLLACFPDPYAQTKWHKIRLGKCLFAPNLKSDPGGFIPHSTFFFFFASRFRDVVGNRLTYFTELACPKNNFKTQQERII